MSTPLDPASQAIYRQVGDLLAAELDDIVVHLTDAYRRELPKYDEVPRASIEPNIRALLEIAIRQFQRGREPDDNTASELAALARRSADSPLPLSAISRSVQLGAHELLVRVRKSVKALSLDRDTGELLEDNAWRWAMQGAAAIAEAERDQAVATARRDATRRSDFLRDAAAGALTSARLRDEAPIYGLDLATEYLAVLACPDQPNHMAELETALRSSGATTTHRVMQSTSNGQIIALAPQRPRAPAGTTVAIGPPRTLAEISASFTEAAEVLATARGLGLTGLVDLVTLGPLTIVAIGDDAARRLSHHHFADVGDAFDDIERTVLAFLERDQSVDDLAAELHLHRNTVRYRITRFREATGLDIRRTRDLVTAWWLLTWRQARGTNDDTRLL